MGYSQMAALRDAFESLGAEVILADAGDYSQGTTYVSTTKGADAIEMMNVAGYDVATLGNHEFDYGYPQLKENLSKADFAVLCANILKDGENVFQGNTIIEKAGVKIGFFGLDTPEAQTKANPALMQGLSFYAEKELYACAQAQIDELRANGADIGCLPRPPRRGQGIRPQPLHRPLCQCHRSRLHHRRPLPHRDGGGCER